VLVVGTSSQAAKVIEEVATNTRGRYHIIGVVDDSIDGRQTPGVAPWLGPLDQLGRIIEASRPSWIVIALSEGAGTPEGPLLDARLRGIRVEEAGSFLEHATGKVAIETLTSSSLILSDGFRHLETGPSDVSVALTRLLNLVVAGLCLVLLAPLFGIIALAIKLDSPGSICFRQGRVGQGGRHFDLVKFRTMWGSEEVTSEWVCDNVHRITRVGRWLRRFRLDELPQFLNVLKGEMNLVGPRPHPISNYALFLEHIPHYRWRMVVRPGITGWAQVRYGYANGLGEETEKMRYDLYYLKHRGVGLDLRILLETLSVLVLDRRNHDGAQRQGPDYFGPGRGWPAAWHGSPSRPTPV
jgi:lipopolysaccharide/colanic/teichoic acid biosynthesis glycosyltransferase